MRRLRSLLPIPLLTRVIHTHDIPQAPPTPSTLTVDAWDESQLLAPLSASPSPSSDDRNSSSSAMQWSMKTMEALYAGRIRGQAFPIFDLSICGAPVFGA